MKLGPSICVINVSITDTRPGPGDNQQGHIQTVSRRPDPGRVALGMKSTSASAEGSCSTLASTNSMSSPPMKGAHAAEVCVMCCFWVSSYLGSWGDALELIEHPRGIVSGVGDVSVSF